MVALEALFVALFYVVGIMCLVVAARLLIDVWQDASYDGAVDEFWLDRIADQTERRSRG